MSLQSPLNFRLLRTAKVAGEQTMVPEERLLKISSWAEHSLNSARRWSRTVGTQQPGLNSAVIIRRCSRCYCKLYEEQPRLDWEHLADMMHDSRASSPIPQYHTVRSAGYLERLSPTVRLDRVEAAALRLRSNTVYRFLKR